MDISPGWLLASLLVSTVGVGLFVYGKKQTRFPQLIAGLALIIFPNFVGSVAWMLSITVVLLGGLWLVVRAGV